MSADSGESIDEKLAEMEEGLGIEDQPRLDDRSIDEMFAEMEEKLGIPSIQEERAFTPKREEHRTEHYPPRPYPEQNLSETKVYLITTDIYTKIGISKCPEARLETIQSHTPLLAELATTIRSDRPDKTEAHLHENFKDHQTETGREWFILHDEEIDQLKEIEVLTEHGARLLFDMGYSPDRIPDKHLR